MTRIACLHGHYSNISLLSDAFVAFDVELIHFVDPGLLLKNAGNPIHTTEQAHTKLREQLSWMQSCAVDAMVITCTQYAALLTPEDEATATVPIFTIDGPFFHELARYSKPQVLLFSNPATVQPTMERLVKHAHSHNLHPEIQVSLVENAFALLMENKQEAYREAIKDALYQLHQTFPDQPIAVAQLSMVPVADQFAKENGYTISHPIHSLTSQMSATLPLRRNR
ncbi:hypothetical protein E8L90_03740 [Brevibacillus antibioticus]|uniref:Aspartate/glutamate racemase family protein n=1 Tax=Brevibacillus antibioticus TaxID=2570228 RepID=A0A4U2Y2I1_9BACL|nr:hypothetical protein [Brevibacillus antibioticus]TKI54616.1 hypothetical protein E8L90_03740 [Brevibacillus antibioticus]